MKQSQSDLIVIVPNLSLSDQASKWVFASIATVSLTIGAVFASLGAWPIFPIAGGEILFLAWAMKLNRKACSRREVVEIDDHYVRVGVGYKSPEQVCAFTRAWTQVLVVPSQHSHHRSHLLLRSAGKQVELGSFLSDEERDSLAKRLKKLIDSRPGERPGEGQMQ